MIAAMRCDPAASVLLQRQGQDSDCWLSERLKTQEMRVSL
jgi:hypothetical protein